MKDIGNLKSYDIKWIPIFSRDRYRKIIQIYLKLYINIKSIFIRNNISLVLNHLNVINSINIDQHRPISMTIRLFVHMELTYFSFSFSFSYFCK